MFGLEEKKKDVGTSKDEDATDCCSTKQADATAVSIRKEKSSTFPTSHFELSEEQDLDAITGDTWTCVKFTADFCKPCKSIAPLFEALSQSEEYGKFVHFVSIDVEKHEELQNQHSVLKLPTFLAFKNGNEHSRMSGADEVKLKEFMKLAFPQ